MQIKTTVYKSRNRRTEITVDHADGTDLDILLAPVILSALLNYRKNLLERMSMLPEQFLLDLGWPRHSSQSEFDFMQEAEDVAFDLAKEKWLLCVDKMIWAFSQIISNDSSQYEIGNIESGEYYLDIVGEAFYRERIQEGLEFFGRYYRNFWV